MTRRLLASLVLLLAPTAAHAQEGPLGRVPNIVTIDGLVGVAQIHGKAAAPSSSESNDLYLGTLGTVNGLTQLPLLRLGYHRVLGPVTLGSGFYYGTVSGGSQLAFAPRLGFVVPVGATAALWPRGGLTFGRQATDFETRTQTYAAAELMIVVTPVSDFGVMFGPFIETGVSSTVSFTGGPFGTRPQSSMDGPIYRLIGVTLGFLADF